MSRADILASHPPKASLSTLYWTARNPPEDPTQSFQGQTILITGPNTGLGFEAALKFAKLGASKLIFGVRSIERGNAAKRRILEQIKGKPSPDLIEVAELDMMSFASVARFAEQINSKYSQVHAVVLNAGIAAAKYIQSPDGWESSLQVNVLSTAYLAILLLPMLRKTAQSSGNPTHLQIVASGGHGDVEAISIQDSGRVVDKVTKEENFSVLKQYSITKLLVMYVMNQLASKVSAKEVIVLAVCPGLCKSDIAREAPYIIQKIDGVWKSIFARSTEEGSRTLVSGITLGEKAHGQFWTNDRISM